MTTPAPKKPGAVNNTDRPSTGEWSEEKAREVLRSGQCVGPSCPGCKTDLELAEAKGIMNGIAIEHKRAEKLASAARLILGWLQASVGARKAIPEHLRPDLLMARLETELKLLEEQQKEGQP